MEKDFLINLIETQSHEEKTSQAQGDQKSSSTIKSHPLSSNFPYFHGNSTYRSLSLSLSVSTFQSFPMADNRENPNPSPKVVDRKTVKLSTSDGDIFEVEEAVAMELQTVKALFEEDGVSYDTVFPLLNVSSSALAKVIQYCRGAVQFSAKLAASDEEGRKEVEKEREAFEAKFVNEEFGDGSPASNECLKKLILAANYLNIKDMLSFLLQAAADRIKNKSVKYVRRFFGVKNDFTPEEEKALHDKNAWAFENIDADENSDADADENVDAD